MRNITGDLLLRMMMCAGSFVATGCAINERGFVTARWYESRSARIIELNTWGVHLMTAAGDRDVTIGHSSRTYVFPLKDGAACTSVADVLAHKGSVGTTHPVPCEDCPSLTRLGEPVSRITRSSGLSVSAGPDRFGIFLGVRSRAAIELPANSQVQLWLRYGPTHPPEADICIPKETR
jgi:hypothetical protein